MNEEHWAESLRFHLAGAARAAGELELAPIVRSVRRLQKLAPPAPEPVAVAETVAPPGPLTIERPIDKRTIHDQLERMSNDAKIFYS